MDYDKHTMEQVTEAHDRAAERLHGEPIDETTADMIGFEQIASAIRDLVPVEFTGMAYFYGAQTAPGAQQALAATGRGYSQTEDEEAVVEFVAQMLGGAFLLGSLTHAEYAQEERRGWLALLEQLYRGERPPPTDLPGSLKHLADKHLNPKGDSE